MYLRESWLGGIKGEWGNLPMDYTTSNTWPSHLTPRVKLRFPINSLWQCVTHELLPCIGREPFYTVSSLCQWSHRSVFLASRSVPRTWLIEPSWTTSTTTSGIFTSGSRSSLRMSWNWSLAILMCSWVLPSLVWLQDFIFWFVAVNALTCAITLLYTGSWQGQSRWWFRWKRNSVPKEEINPEPLKY